MEDKTKECFCCGKKININTEECPFCGAEQTKILTKNDVDNINYDIKSRKISAIIGLIVGFFASVAFGGINLNSYLFVIGIILGFASYLVSLFICDKIRASHTQKGNENNSDKDQYPSDKSVR